MNEHDVIEKIQKDGVTIRIYQDDDPLNPREEFDNLGTMVCFHRSYNLGDKKHGFSDPDSVLEYLKENRAIVLPLYLYEHGGITMSTGQFSDPWDSGQVGVIFITYERIRKEYGWKYITSARAKQIHEYLKNEVKTYDDYLTGSVYGYTVTCDTCGEELDSCWGFYGYDHKESGLLEYASGHKCKNCEEIQARLDNLIPDDGYADGGEPYTQSELEFMQGEK